jgi:WD40 repeat protein
LTILKFGNFIASGSHPTINIYSIDQLMSSRSSKPSIATLNGHSNSVYCLSQNGKFLVSGSKDSSIILWNLSSFGFVRQFVGHQHTVCDVSLLDNERIVSSSLDSSVRVWDMKTAECIKIMKYHCGCVHSIFRHEKFFLSSGRDAKITAWDFKKFNPIFTISDQCAIVDVLLMHEGHLFGGCVDGRLFVWNLTTTIKTHEMIENISKKLNSNTYTDVIVFTFQ